MQAGKQHGFDYLEARWYILTNVFPTLWNDLNEWNSARFVKYGREICRTSSRPALAHEISCSVIYAHTLFNTDVITIVGFYCKSWKRRGKSALLIYLTILHYYLKRCSKPNTQCTWNKWQHILINYRTTENAAIHFDINIVKTLKSFFEKWVSVSQM